MCQIAVVAVSNWVTKALSHYRHYNCNHWITEKKKIHVKVINVPIVVVKLVSFNSLDEWTKILIVLSRVLQQWQKKKNFFSAITKE